MNKTKKPLVGAQKFIFLVSVGRSGSTFFGHRLAYHGGFHYFGEKRFLWSTMRVFPFLGMYFLRRNLKLNTSNSIVLDKTPCMHKNLGIAHKQVEIMYLIILERDVAAINRSAERIEQSSGGVNRLWLRMQKYWVEYGVFGFIAPLARFHHVFHAFGIRTGAFGRSLFSKPLQSEVADMVEQTEAFATKNKIPLLKVAYENFAKDCQQLTEMGLNQDQIDKLVLDFSPQK